jgi:hypothetical protein
MHDDIELIYTKKAGYILLYGIKAEERRIVMAPMFVRDGEHLCDFLLFEIVHDVLRDINSGHDIGEVTAEERSLIEEAFEPYLKQLPEYKELGPLQFVDSYEDNNSKIPECLY